MGIAHICHPEDLRSRSEEKTEKNLFTLYDETRTEKVNIALRLPILLFNGLMILYFYWVIWKFSGSKKLGALSALFLAISPFFPLSDVFPCFIAFSPHIFFCCYRSSWMWSVLNPPILPKVFFFFPLPSFPPPWLTVSIRVPVCVFIL